MKVFALLMGALVALNTTALADPGETIVQALHRMPSLKLQTPAPKDEDSATSFYILPQARMTDHRDRFLGASTLKLEVKNGLVYAEGFRWDDAQSSLCARDTIAFALMTSQHNPPYFSKEVSADFATARSVERAGGIWAWRGHRFGYTCMTFNNVLRVTTLRELRFP